MHSIGADSLKAEQLLKAASLQNTSLDNVIVNAIIKVKPGLILSVTTTYQENFAYQLIRKYKLHQTFSITEPSHFSTSVPYNDKVAFPG